MTQEDKEIVLKDLCIRLPYKTYVKTTKGIGYIYAINTSQLIELSVANDSEYWSEVFNIDEIKPYLRPMSSMTEEERKYFQKLAFPYDFVDALNKCHFDYRGLIQKGLAIAVTKENNLYKE